MDKLWMELAMKTDSEFKDWAAQIGYTPAPHEAINHFRVRVISCVETMGKWFNG